MGANANNSFSAQLEASKVPTDSSQLFQSNQPQPGSGWNAAAGIASGLGGLFSGLSALEAGKARESQARFRARMAEIRSEDAIERGKEAEKRLRQEISQLVGKQRTTYAAGNVQLDETGSSASAVEEQTLLFGDEDAMTIRANAMREAMGYKAQAAGFELEASQSRVQGFDQAGASLLTGTGNALQMYRMFGRG